MWMLKKMRFLHKWSGIVLAALIIAIALSGLLMNHKDWLECDQAGGPGGRQDVALSHFSDVNAADAIGKVADQCGNMDNKEIKIKREKGGYTWEIKARDGGKIKISDGVRRSGFGDGKRRSGLKQLVERVHKGEFAGSVGFYLIDIGAVSIIVLTLSGLYISLWIMYKKRRVARSHAGQE